MDYKYQAGKIENQIEEQSGEYIPKTEKSEQEMRVDILAHALNTANRMIDFNEKHEVQKSKWRKNFIILFCLLLIISFAFTVLLLFLGKLSDLQLTILVVNLIVEILAIIFFMLTLPTAKAGGFLLHRPPLAQPSLTRTHSGVHSRVPHGIGTSASVRCHPCMFTHRVFSFPLSGCCLPR